jgi:hypothetical protein
LLLRRFCWKPVPASCDGLPGLDRCAADGRLWSELRVWSA